MKSKQTTGSHTTTFIEISISLIESLSTADIDRLVKELATLKSRDGRLYLLGLGGNAATAAHAASDIRTLSGIKAVSLTDNIPAFTACANDSSWVDSFTVLLRENNLCAYDCLLVLSVSGGGRDGATSVPIVRAMRFADSVGCSILSITANPNSQAAQLSTVHVAIGSNNSDATPTPYEHAESIQLMICQLLAYHPSLRKAIKAPATDD